MQFFQLVSKVSQNCWPEEINPLSPFSSLEVYVACRHLWDRKLLCLQQVSGLNTQCLPLLHDWALSSEHLPHFHREVQIFWNKCRLEGIQECTLQSYASFFFFFFFPVQYLSTIPHFSRKVHTGSCITNTFEDICTNSPHTFSPKYFWAFVLKTP